MRLLTLLLALSSPALAQPTPPEYTTQFRDLAAARQPEGSNGAEILLDLAPRLQRFEQSLADRGIYLTDTGPNTDLDPSDHQRQLDHIREAIDDARTSGLLEDIARLTAADNLLPPDLARWTREQERNFLSPTRTIARVNMARLDLALQRGDAAAAIEAVEQTLWLSRRTAALSTSAAHFSGRSIEIALLRRIREQIVAGRIDAHLARQLLDTVDAALPIVPIAEVYEAQRLLRRGDMAILYNARGQMVPERLRALTIDGIDRAALDPAADGDPHLPDLDQMLAWHDRFSEPLAAVAAAIPRERGEIYDALAEAERLFDHPNPETLDARVVLFATISSGSVSQARFADHLALHHTATRIMLAIEIYRARHGAPPPSLQVLLPEILPNVPDDPFTHAPLHYTPDPDAPLGYILYSAGYDATDNRGRPWPEPDLSYKALTNEAEGFDYPLTPPNPSR